MNSLYAKMSKCLFAAKQVEYLGLIIYGKGISTDPSNIKAMQNCPTPSCETIGDNTYTGTKYTWTNGELRRKGKLVVGSDEHLRKASVTYFHCDPIGGHSGVHVTLQKMGTVLLTKYAYFIPMSHLFTASQVAQVFLGNVYKLHGMPNTIVSDRDKIFINQFWQSLFKVMLLQLNLSTAYHPQTDGQTEVVNKCVECFMSSPHTTPFDIVYGQPPNLNLPYIASTIFGEEMDRAISMLQFHLKRSRERIKNMTDKNRSDRNFEVGMQMYLKLQSSSKARNTAQICSQLKLCKGTNHQVGSLLEYGRDGVLIKWVNQAEEDATWELYTDLIKRFPQMELHS
ncbi:retrotransposable element Tf2 [Tanacetum coccineum]